MKLGFFDSGIGGLTILEETHKLMPAYDTIYLGDSARSPYGEKTQEDLVRFLTEAVTWLFDKDCDLIIVACNTASVKALRIVQDFFLRSVQKKEFWEL